MTFAEISLKITQLLFSTCWCDCLAFLLSAVNLNLQSTVFSLGLSTEKNVLLGFQVLAFKNYLNRHSFPMFV